MKLMVMLLLLLLCSPLAAQGVGGDLVVVVRTEAGQPLPDATVTVDGAQARLWRGLAVGTHTVTVRHPGYEDHQEKILIVAGRVTTVTVQLQSVERVIQVKEQRQRVNPDDPNAGTPVRDRTFIEQQAGQGDLQGVLSTLPGVQSDSTGQIHPRGEHRAIGYSVDGMALPEPLESMSSPLIDPRLLDGVSMQMGGYDASLGGETGAVVNLSTWHDNRKAFAEIVPGLGSFGSEDVLFRGGGHSDDGRFSYFVGGVQSQTDLRSEPPVPDPQTLGNNGWNTNLVARVQEQHGDDQGNLVFIYQNGLFDIPQTPFNFAAGVRQDETDSNMVAALSWRHRIDAQANIRYGLSWWQANENIDNNGVFTPFIPFAQGSQQGSQSPDVSQSLASGNFPLDPTNPGSPYLPTTRLQTQQIQPIVEYSHDRLHLGASVDFISMHQFVDVIDAGGGGGLPNPALTSPAPTQFLADVTRHASLESAWYSQTFQVHRVVINTGLRADWYYDGATIHAAQLSPRLNVAVPTSDTQVLRFSYDRLFQVPPLEIDASGLSVAFPQATDALEASYEFEPAHNVVAKAAVVSKFFHDPLDVALLIPNSNIPLLGPVNFGSGYYHGIEFSVSSYRKEGWNGFLTATVGEAQPLTPAPFNPVVPEFSDQDQRAQLTGGLSYATQSGWVGSVDALYASGYPQVAIPLYNQVGINPFGLVGDRIGRFIMDLKLTRVAADGHPQLTFAVHNLFDDRSVINFLSGFSGTRFEEGRRLELGGTWRL